MVSGVSRIFFRGVTSIVESLRGKSLMQDQLRLPSSDIPVRLPNLLISFFVSHLVLFILLANAGKEVASLQADLYADGDDDISEIDISSITPFFVLLDKWH